MKHARIDTDNLSHMTNITPHGPPVFFRIDQHLTRHNEFAIFAAHPDRGVSLLIDEGHDLFIDPVEHHLDHFHGRGIGHAHTTDKMRGNVQALEQLPNLRATTVDDNRLHTHVFEQDDVLGKVLLEVFVLHGVPAVFDNNGLAGKTTNKRQGFQQDIGLLNEFVHTHIRAQAYCPMLSASLCSVTCPGSRAAWFLVSLDYNGRPCGHVCFFGRCISPASFI